MARVRSSRNVSRTPADDPEALGARDLLDGTVERAAVRAYGNPATAGVDLLDGLLLPQNVGVRGPHRREVRLALGVLQKEARARLADALQDLDGGVEVADVKDGQSELDVAEVADALREVLLAGLALRALRGDAEAAVEAAVLAGLARAELVELAGADVHLRHARHFYAGEKTELDARDPRGPILVRHELLFRFGRVGAALARVARAAGAPAGGGGASAAVAVAAAGQRMCIKAAR
jgi:hypothetical protein